mmetsp:Transcript_45613/g.145246  ORF Transcript_45613/g.145246 Transcript_45613/m.145246 type:complete len:779 (-) Transcript_45613:542-2878(-)
MARGLPVLDSGRLPRQRARAHQHHHPIRRVEVPAPAMPPEVPRAVHHRRHPQCRRRHHEPLRHPLTLRVAPIQRSGGDQVEVVILPPDTLAGVGSAPRRDAVGRDVVEGTGPARGRRQLDCRPGATHVGVLDTAVGQDEVHVCSAVYDHIDIAHEGIVVRWGHSEPRLGEVTGDYYNLPVLSSLRQCPRPQPALAQGGLERLQRGPRRPRADDAAQLGSGVLGELCQQGAPQVPRGARHEHALGGLEHGRVAGVDRHHLGGQLLPEHRIRLHHLHEGQRELPKGRHLPPIHRLGVEPPGHCFRRRVLEERLDRDFHSEDLGQARGEPGGRERVPPELEERIRAVRSPGLQVELLLDRLEHHRDHLPLLSVMGHGEVLGEALPAGPRGRGRGETLAVDLVHRRGHHRDLVQHHIHPRHHVVREVLPQRRHQRRARPVAIDVEVRCAPSGVGVEYEVCHEPLVIALVSHSLDQARLHSDVADYGLLDRTQYHAVPAHFHHEVAPPEDLHVAGLGQPCQVARAVQGLARRGVLNKALHGHLRQFQVSVPDRRPTDVELAYAPLRHGLLVVVQDEQVDEGRGPPGGAELGKLGGVMLPPQVLAGDLATLGDGVDVEDTAGGREERLAPGQEVRCHHLAVQKDRLERAELVLDLLGGEARQDRLREARGEENLIDLVLLHVIRQRRDVVDHVVRDDDGCPAAHQRTEALPHEEHVAGHLPPRAVARQGLLTPHIRVHRAAVRGENALGFAGGPGGVDDIDEVVLRGLHLVPCELVAQRGHCGG